MANSKKLFVGNISHSMNNDDLKKVFEPFGEVLSAQIVMDRETGRSRGFGFVEMENNRAADDAIKALNDKEVAGRNITVNEAKPRDNGKPNHRSFHKQRER